MIVDSIIILATVEFIERKIEEKLLEFDALNDEYTFEEAAQIRSQVLALLSKLRQENVRMDEFMAKYRRQLDEKKVMLSHSRQRKPIYLRGVPTYTSRQGRGNKVQG